MNREDDADKFLYTLTNNSIDPLIREQIAPYSCQLLHRDPQGKLAAFASGVWAILDGAHYLLTSGHVIEDWSDDHPLLVKAKDGYHHVMGKGVFTQYRRSERVDVACIRVADPSLSTFLSYYRFVDLETSPDPERLEVYNCLVYGYDEKQTDKKTLEAKATASFVRQLPQKVLDYYGLQPSTHYVLEARGAALDLATGALKKVNTNPHGMSGAGLWYIYYIADGDGYVPQAYLIGLLSQYRTGRYPCLIAERTSLLRSVIRDNLDGFLFP